MDGKNRGKNYILLLIFGCCFWLKIRRGKGLGRMEKYWVKGFAIFLVYFNFLFANNCLMSSKSFGLASASLSLIKSSKLITKISVPLKSIISLLSNDNLNFNNPFNSGKKSSVNLSISNLKNELFGLGDCSYLNFETSCPNSSNVSRSLK